MIEVEQITVSVPVKMATTIKRAVESGDYASNSEVFYDALRDWEYKRQLQQRAVEHIKANVQRGLADLQAGRTKTSEEVFARLEEKYQVVL